MNAAAQGDTALANSDYPTAIRLFTQALTELPRVPTYYIKRSTAFSRLKTTDGGPNFHAALRDAEIALALAQERAKRELILSAQMRRGVVLYQLERYGDAAFVFGIIQGKVGMGTESQDKSEKIQNAMAGSGAASSAKKGYEQELPIWTLKVKSKLNKLPEGDEKAAVTVEEYPKGVPIPSEKDLKRQFEALKTGKIEDSVAESSSKDDKLTKVDTSATTSLNSKGAAETATSTAASSVENIRHEWYQSHDSVVVTLYVKGVAKDSVDTELNDDSATLQFPLLSGADYAFSLDPLFAPIDPSTSKVSVMSTKIELVLRKKIPGQKWSALEASSSGVKLADRQAVVGSASASSTGPVYPSSSRHGAKDWDKVASTLTAKKAKTKADDKKQKEKTDNDDAGAESDSADSIDSDYGTGDPVDGFFKKLYANADPDTRRAMMKSYVESQGTSLSTNWDEVSRGKVEARPPSD